EAELNQTGVLGVVVMLRLLHARIVQVLDVDRTVEAVGHDLRDLLNGEGLRHLVEHSEITTLTGILRSKADAFHRVADIDDATSLPAAAIDSHRVAQHG